MGKRAALYLRVSTARQAEKDLSLPDQRRQAEEHCKTVGWAVVAEYVEPGKSATDDKRPALQRMIDEATGPDRPFDVIVVHSYSRFFRDAYLFEFYRRKLEKHGVSLVSITQNVSDDPAGGLIRQVFNMFDEYQSKENAKHVLRAMKENARQGYWNGSQPPYGYQAVAVEVRADATKKKLDVEHSEAETIKLIFDLYLEGHGIRAVADQLNRRGLRYRRGRKWASTLVHAALTRTAYRGTHYFNVRDSKTHATKSPSEWVPFETPIIIEPDRFERVQAKLKKHRPTQTPPRVVNGPTLLTGVAKCATCGGGMTLRTGKGGRYRYYTCNKRATEGRTSCDGRNIPMASLDALVVEQLAVKVFAPERVKAIISELAKRQREKATEGQGELRDLNKERRRIDEKVDRLLDALSEGLVEDGDGFRRKMSQLNQQREELLRRSAAVNRRCDVPKDVLSEANVDLFVAQARAKLTDPDSKFRKAYVKLFVDRVDVGDEEIRIQGPKSALISGVLESTKPGNHPVPSFVSD